MKKRDIILGMNYGTASNRLKKEVLFNLAKKCGLLNCFRCGKPIENINDFSLDHKVSWVNDKTLFWDLDNIAFSHSKCNFIDGASITNRKKTWSHGDYGYRKKGCRCEICMLAHKKYRTKKVPLTPL